MTDEKDEHVWYRLNVPVPNIDRITNCWHDADGVYHEKVTMIDESKMKLRPLTLNELEKVPQVTRDFVKYLNDLVKVIPLGVTELLDRSWRLSDPDQETLVKDFPNIVLREEPYSTVTTERTYVSLSGLGLLAGFFNGVTHRIVARFDDNEIIIGFYLGTMDEWR